MTKPPRVKPSQIVDVEQDLGEKIPVTPSSLTREKLRETLKNLISTSNSEDRSQIGQILREMHADPHRDCTLSIIESAIYYDNIGDAVQALQVACIGVTRAENESLYLKRKAHNTAGIMFSRVCDYEKSCFHLEIALSISVETKNKLYEFAAVCNVISVLLNMGLIEEAKSLCKRACTYPSGTQELDFLHVQNAINGFRLFKHSDDYEALKQFNAIALSRLRTAGPIDAHWKAYIDAQTALLMSYDERYIEAITFLENILLSRNPITNVRAKVILLCAFASCCMAERSQHLKHKCKKLLSDVLAETQCYPLHREEVLRKLVELHESEQSSEENKAASLYKAMLSTHVIGVKHRQFYDRINRNSVEQWPLVPKLTRPYYGVPVLLTNAGEAFRRASIINEDIYVNGTDDVRTIVSSVETCERQSIEASLRTDEYEIAEDWALAADFIIHRMFNHGLCVGKIAGAICRELGMSIQQSVAIEMACRLHDIGKIIVDSDLQKMVADGDVDEFRLVKEHTEYGGQLLDRSRDPILVTASRIARYHHAWWNGCGYPAELRREAIPFEARICCIANTYISLRCPVNKQRAWDRADALRQMASMAGVQTDPELTDVFLTMAGKIEKELDFHFDLPIDQSSPTFINEAKIRLLDTVELLDLSS